jgi:uncharacterized protein YkwD
MQKPSSKQLSQATRAAISLRFNRLGGAAIVVAIGSAVLLSGWPLPQGVSSESTVEAGASELLPGAFAVRTDPIDRPSSASTSLAVTEERSVLSMQAPTDELAETHDLLVRYWTTNRRESQSTVSAVAAPSEPTIVPQSTTQSNVAPPLSAVTPPADAVAGSVVAPVEEPELAPASQVAPVANPTALPLSAEETGLFDAMNEARIANGLPALIVKDMLTDVARARSEEMTRLNYFAHYYEGGTSAFELLRLAGARFSKAGENLAKVHGAGDQSVELAINALMGSVAHRANILEPRYVRVGVGAVTSDDGVTVFTMIYADR